MAYNGISRYNGFSNGSKNMVGKVDGVFGGGRNPIGGLVVSKGVWGEDSDSRFGGRVP